MNFRKSLVSLAAVLALSNMVMADDTATYIPLSSKTADSMWSLFGVNGFSTGVASVVTTGSSNFSANLVATTETSTTDDLATAAASGLLSLQALNSTGSFGTGLAIGVNTSAVVLDGTEQVRTMYVKVGDNEPNVKIDYKASLENAPFEIILNDTTYNGTINQAFTWSQAPTLATGSLTSVSSGTDRSAIAEVLDFKFSDNPVDPKYFAFATDLNTTGQTASFYNFNAAIQQWEVYQKGAPTNAQDFTSFAAGKAYWGRADLTDSLGALTNDSDGAVGLVLGTATNSGLPDATRFGAAGTNPLTSGWNMVAFDDDKSFIRHAPTGLVISDANGSILKFTDDSGLNAVQVPQTTVTGIVPADIVAINRTIESGKLRGVIPASFNIKVYATGTANQLVVVSDKQFTVSDVGTNSLDDVTTMLGNNPYISGLKTTAVADLNDSFPATSVYGEYMLGLDVLTRENAGGDGAVDDNISSSTGGFAKMTFKEPDFTEQISITTAGTQTLAQFKTNVEASANTIYKATQIDVNNDGAATGDLMIVANDQAFSVKDDTYSRIFKYVAAAGSVTVDIGSGTAVAIGGADTIATAAFNIDGSASGVANFFAGAADATTIVAVSNDKSVFDVKDAASGTVDILSPLSSVDSNLSKGAVNGVYSLDNIARLAVGQVSKTLTFITPTNTDSNLSTAGSDFNISINDNVGLTGTLVNAASGALDTYDELVAFLDLLVTTTNTHAQALGIHASASHSYEIPVGTLGTDKLGSATTIATKFILAGVDVESFDLNMSASTADSYTTDGNNTIDPGAGDLVADLKANTWASPDYAIYGPLYTLNEAGFAASAILKASTETNATTGTIVWDSIDITRNENDWFLNNEFSLFNIHNNNGYWVYLDPVVASTLAITSATLGTPAYSYYFSNDSTTTPKYATTNRIESAGLTVSISNLNDTTNGNAGSAYANVGGENVQLVRSGTTNSFTANIGSYSLKSLTPQSGPVSINIRAVNGKGVAVSSTALVSLDYEAPTDVVATITNGVDITLTAQGMDADSNFFAFNTFIPEVQSVRDAAIATGGTGEAIASADGNATFNACKKTSFGDDTTYRIVAADGAKNASNYSAATQIIYSNTISGADLLTHTAGNTTQAAGVLYDTNCSIVTDNSASTTYNAGVSLETLTNLQTSKMTYVPIANVNFTTDLNWIANFAINGSTTGVIQVKFVSSYASKSFYVAYDSKLYKGTFPATQPAADGSTIDGAAIPMTLITGANTAIAP